VTAIAPDAEELRVLDAGTRLAWKTYCDRVRDLHGEEYERVEEDSWAELQSELRRLERRRQSLNVVPS
jgi:hypothetical protein